MNFLIKKETSNDIIAGNGTARFRIITEELRNGMAAIPKKDIIFEWIRQLASL